MVSNLSFTNRGNKVVVIIKSTENFSTFMPAFECSVARRPQNSNFSPFGWSSFALRPSNQAFEWKRDSNLVSMSSSSEENEFHEAPPISCKEISKHLFHCLQNKLIAKQVKNAFQYHRLTCCYAALPALSRQQSCPYHSPPQALFPQHSKADSDVIMENNTKLRYRFYKKPLPFHPPIPPPHPRAIDHPNFVAVKFAEVAPGCKQQELESNLVLVLQFGY